MDTQTKVLNYCAGIDVLIQGNKTSIVFDTDTLLNMSDYEITQVKEKIKHNLITAGIIRS